MLCYGNRLCAECVYSLAASTHTVLSAVQRLGGFIPLGESPNILPLLYRLHPMTLTESPVILSTASLHAHMLTLLFVYLL